MTDTPQLAGADLARLALANARAAAKTAPSKTTRTGPRRTMRRGTGRDPITLASAITELGADLPLEVGTAGGNVIDQWDTLCPQFADTVQPVAYDTDRGRLDLRPVSHAYAAQLRLLGGQLAKQINDKVSRTVVRSIRVLPVGVLTARQPADAAQAVAESAPVKTRETASEGFRRNLELALAHRPEHAPTVPLLREAIERQNAVLKHPANREPETAFTDAVAEAERFAAPEPDRAEAIRRAAIARKQAGGDAPVRRAFDVA
ncbi:DciA family protein [Leifsonia sp. NPDC058292]|uniref:DciA family protein n=1 Tax=Leifsonia sp. NPDC058292 TaxID=3346428 RepID=UPI0036DA8C8B